MELVNKFADDVIVKDGVITAVLSTEGIDRDGDIVRLDGWELANFLTAPRLMSCHDYSSLTKQIGEWRNVHVDPRRKALIGEAHYYTGQGNPEADWGYYLASIGQATYSVGFLPLEAEPRKGHGGSVYTSQELLETSHVPIPSQPEALQLMAKALQSRQRRGTSTATPRQAGRMVRKWDSATMDDTDDLGYGPPDFHCLVPGCDDAAQITVGVCAEHLKVLMNAPPEPPGGELDEEIEGQIMAFTRPLLRRLKAGKVLSGANLDKLHGALTSLGAVHDGACDGEDCPLDGEEPPAARDKAAAPTPTTPPDDKSFDLAARIEAELTTLLEAY